MNNYTWFKHVSLPLDYLIMDGQQFFLLSDVVNLLQKKGVSKINSQKLSRWASKKDIITIFLDNKNSKPRKLINNRAFLHILTHRDVLDQRKLLCLFTATFNSIEKPTRNLPGSNTALPVPSNLHVKQQVAHELKTLDRKTKDFNRSFSQANDCFSIQDLINSLRDVNLEDSNLNKTKISANVRSLRLKWLGHDYIGHVKFKDPNATVSATPVPIFPKSEFKFIQKFVSQLFQLGLERSNYKTLKALIPALIVKLIREDNKKTK